VSGGGHVERISLAPVKGLGLVHPEAVELSRSGALGDRAFYLIDADGRMVNGKRAGPLVQVSPAYDAESDVLRLTLPGGDVIEQPVRTDGAVITSFFGRPVTGKVVEGPFSEALSEVAGLPLRLVRADRPGAGPDRGPTVSLLGTASVLRLSAAAGVDEPLDTRRFRMSLDVGGLEAHEEDAWIGYRIRIGTAVALVTGHVGRCLVTSQDPDRGVTDVDTLGALATYRRDLPTSEPLALGVWGEIVEPGVARIGDEVAPAR
jgi:uncharacterized protein YcbX